MELQTGFWVQAADGDWTKFPTATTDGTGAITQSPWIYYKFGDATKTGPYALIVSLSTGVSGTTKNGTSFVPVTVFDPATEGGWVHDGVDNSSFTNKRTDIVDQATPGNPLALRFTEKNLVDDDNNGVVDDEQYGPVQNGSFDMAVPKARPLTSACRSRHAGRGAERLHSHRSRHRCGPRRRRHDGPVCPRHTDWRRRPSAAST